MAGTADILRQFRGECDRIFALLKEATRNSEITRSTVAQVLEMKLQALSPLWSEKHDGHGSLEEVVASQDGKKPVVVSIKVLKRAEAVREMLEFVERRRKLLELDNKRNAVGAAGDGSARGVVETGPTQFGPWTSYPPDPEEERRFVVDELASLCRKRANNGAPAPVVHISPVVLHNVSLILRDTRERLRQGGIGKPLNELIGGIVLKMIRPNLWESLFESGLMFDDPAAFDINARDVASFGKGHFDEKPTKDKTQWMRVSSYWNGLPPFHALYIEGCDWIHVGPWVPNVEGRLKAWEIGSFRVNKEVAPAAFKAYREALIAEGVMVDRLAVKAKLTVFAKKRRSRASK
jgi:hypothetical protein